MEALGGLAERSADLDGPVLDSSCGSGHMLERLRDRYAPGRPLLGIDLSPRMVAIAQERLGDNCAVAPVEGMEMDAVYLAATRTAGPA